ncbi:hypothetical protein BJAS_P3184 [Bathymodiolus japonicus methanotrophic gill symbiont]|uniref:hypothetical protein n=1 Tax=Bathymodiolus japonicus methanotrophic gill symbiont TaxID=113269 RepID=UPI001B3D05DD|nr:hypothetical protein [Bathymodiolus japonicus methanotrophic gill symbiont]GFO72715.1 hypothetical protein BJAS_P3184 [Bathymodiolus japonicus methanotrophic gill symbiont]
MIKIKKMEIFEWCYLQVGYRLLCLGTSSFNGNTDGQHRRWWASLHLTGNRWQQIALNYTLTANTVIEFDFSSNTEGEIHAFGFDTDLRQDKNFAFQLFGTQNWGIGSFNNYSSANGTQHYVTPVGQFYIGQMQYLFFVNDHDVVPATAESLFSNIMVYENTP